MESVFCCEVHEGKIAPNSVLKVPVCFSPLTVDSISVDYLSLTCPGAVSKDLLKVSGTCIGTIYNPTVTAFKTFAYKHIKPGLTILICPL